MATVAKKTFLCTVVTCQLKLKTQDCFHSCFLPYLLFLFTKIVDLAIKKAKNLLQGCLFFMTYDKIHSYTLWRALFAVTMKALTLSIILVQKI